MDRRKWNVFSAFYDVFMWKDAGAYDRICRMIRGVAGGKKVLEIATGTGLIAKRIADAAESVTAVDYAEKMIAKAQKGKVPANIVFEVADAECLPYGDDSFDVIVISNALHIMDHPEKVLKETARVLKRTGVLIAPTFTHGANLKNQMALAKILNTTGFQTEHDWNSYEYLAFLKENGWVPVWAARVRASFPITYAECIYGGNADEHH